MIQRKIRLLMTFFTTSDAFAVEKYCKENGIPGRLIPVPRSITADCGLAWRSELEQRVSMEEIGKRIGIAGLYEIEC